MIFYVLRIQFLSLGLACFLFSYVLLLYVMILFFNVMHLKKNQFFILGLGGCGFGLF